MTPDDIYHYISLIDNTTAHTLALTKLPIEITKYLLAHGFIFLQSNNNEATLTEAGEWLPFIDKRFKRRWPIVSSLGSGGFGAAFRLIDGTTLKVTSDGDEIPCAQYLVRHPQLHPNLPAVYEADYLTNIHGNIIGFYIREELDDALSIGGDRSLIAKDILLKTGIILGDWEQNSNWGTRGLEGTIVFRDLRCYPSQV